MLEIIRGQPEMTASRIISEKRLPEELVSVELVHEKKVSEKEVSRRVVARQRVTENRVDQTVQVPVERIEEHIVVSERSNPVTVCLDFCINVCHHTTQVSF